MAGPKQPKVHHPYFTETRASSWNIINFLNSELTRHGSTHFSFNASLGDWNSALRTLARSGTPTQKTVATQKIAHYKDHPGCLSDKALAMNWRDTRKRRKLNPEEPRQVQAHYYGRVNQVNGDIVNSTINFEGTASVTGSTLDRDSREPSLSPETPFSAPLPHPAPDPDPEDDPNLDSESRLRLLCLSLQELRNTLHDPLVLPSGCILEDCFLPYASSLLQLDPAHGFIADEKLLSTLDAPDCAMVLSRVLPLPAFPEELDRVLRTFTEVTAPTIAGCREVAGDAKDRDLLWISRVLEHMMELITYDVLSLDLGEGTLDSTVNPVLWDNYFLDLPGFFLKRKEVTIPSSMQHQPFQYLTFDPRFDGVFRSRPLVRGPCYELALFEVSGRYDKEAKKWKRDRAKLLAGCRAMLYRLKELVEHDMETVRKLRVVGVLQAGLHSQLLIMQFINANVLHVREGNVWELPRTLQGLSGLSDVVAVAWKAKRVVRETADVVRAYLEGGGKKSTNRTATDFL